jgi:hypothetical protein
VCATPHNLTTSSGGGNGTATVRRSRSADNSGGDKLTVVVNLSGDLGGYDNLQPGG